MNNFQAIILAILQGVTEFLPVSSSGHLVLLQKIFKIDSPPVFFDTLLHLGTLFSTFVFFRKDIFYLFKNWRKKISTWTALFVGSIPVAGFGLVLNSRIEIIFNSLFLVSIAWIITGIFLLLTKKFKNILIEKIENIKKSDALIVGLFQAFALFPGISRSGSTIFGGLFCKFSPQTAFSFSFLLSIPAILGAIIFNVKSVSLAELNLPLCLFSMIIAGITGYFSLKILKKFLISEKLFYFGYYCLILGVTIFIFNEI